MNSKISAPGRCVPYATLASACILSYGVIGTSPSAAADADDSQLPTVTVTATALPGTALDEDKVPGNVQILRAGRPHPRGVGESHGRFELHSQQHQYQ